MVDVEKNMFANSGLGCKRMKYLFKETYAYQIHFRKINKTLSIGQSWN